MDDPSHDQLIEIVGEALRREPAQREEYIRGACQDEAMRAEAMSLLAALDRAGGFLNRPAHAAAAPTHPPPAEAGPAGLSEGPGMLVGRYRLLQKIGEGGFGVVFMAEQREPVHRTVALKIIKLGMDTRSVVARFEQERQALALMDHPGIARVLDGGATAAGRPYFVMELVRGDSLIEHCDKQRLGTEERLDLFSQVCRAIQHAHTKGIIHRDLKPGNILVTTVDGRPVPKVIDFGIAKATGGRLTDKTLFTEFRQLIGTPAYMSPEQADNSSADVDTRTDVYSLGVILYELLTGVTPFDPGKLLSAAWGEMQRIIREDDPPRPSTRLSTMRDALPGLAARRATEPARLAAVIRGDLDWIVMRCLEKDRARRYETAEALAADVGRYLAGEAVLAAPPSASYLLRKFVRRHRVGVTAGAAVGVALVAGLGAALWQAGVARQQRDAAEQSRRQTEQVAEFQASQLRGIDASSMGARLRDDLLNELESGMQRVASDQAEIGSRKKQLASLLGDINLTDVALKGLDATIFTRAIKAVGDKFPDQPGVRAGLLLTIGSTMGELGLLEGAEAPLREALEIRRGLHGDDHAATIAARFALGRLMYDRGRMAECDALLVEALERSGRVNGPEHRDTLNCISALAAARCDEGRTTESERMLREVLPTFRRTLGADHPDTVKAVANLGKALSGGGKAAEAEPFCRESVEMHTRLYGEDHPLTVRAELNLVGALRMQWKTGEALPIAERAVAKLRRTLGENHQDTLRALWLLARTLMIEGRTAEAEPYLRSALENCVGSLGDQHDLTIDVKDTMAQVLIDTDRAAEAEPLLREVLAWRERVQGRGTPITLSTRVSLGRALLALGKFSEAESALLEVRRAAGPAHADACLPDLVRLYEAWDKAEPGKGYDRRAMELRAKADIAPDSMPGKP